MSIQEKLQQLEYELDILEKEVGAVQDVLAYLYDLNNKRQESFAYTNRMPDEQKFEFKGIVDSKEVSVFVKESDVIKYLEFDPKIDQLRKVRSKMNKIEGLLEKDDYGKTK